MKAPKVKFNLSVETIRSGEIVPVLEEVVKMVKYVSAYPVDSIGGEELIEMAVHLAAYKATLGQAFAEHQHAVNVKEAETKHSWTMTYSEFKSNSKIAGDKVTEGEAKAYADSCVFEDEIAIIGMKLTLEKIRNLRSDTGDLITTLQSRISQLKQESRDSSLPLPSTRLH